MDDFTEALKDFPAYWDLYRRRGQSYVALDEHKLALKVCLLLCNYVSLNVLHIRTTKHTIYVAFS